MCALQYFAKTSKALNTFWLMYGGTDENVLFMSKADHRHNEMGLIFLCNVCSNSKKHRGLKSGKKCNLGTVWENCKKNRRFFGLFEVIDVQPYLHYRHIIYCTIFHFSLTARSLNVLVWWYSTTYTATYRHGNSFLPWL